MIILQYVMPIALIVVSNVFYHIFQKSTPQNVNPFVALFVTYLTATALTICAFLVYKTDKGFLESVKALNWTSFTLGIAIVGLEFGYLLAYRVGWNISVGSLVANIFLALMLIPVGMLFYKESFELHKLFGAVFCIIGLILINR